MLSPHIKLFKKTKKGCRTSLHASFSAWIFKINIPVIFYQINIFIVWLPLILEILVNMCILIVCWSGCDVINFEINLLLVPIQQWKHQNNVENQFTFNNKNQWLRFGVWPNFIRCSVSIVDFEQINDGWFFPFLASTVRADSKWYFLFPKWSFFEKATLRFTRYVFPTRYNYHCDALSNLLPFLQF